MDNTDDKQTIRILDKRRFNDEGNDRDISPNGDLKNNIRSDAENKINQNQQSSTQKPSPQAEHISNVTFSAFVMGLATQVLALLGEIPNPENNQIAVNLDAAKQTIDILTMIEEKTKGNLTVDESLLIDEVVHSLKMAFVKKVEENKKAKI